MILNIIGAVSVFCSAACFILSWIANYLEGNTNRALLNTSALFLIAAAICFK